MNHSLVARARYSLWTPWVIPQTTKLASPTTEETKNHCNVDFIEPNSFTYKKLGGLLTLSPKPERLKDLLCKQIRVTQKPFGTLEVLSIVGSAFFARPAETTKGCVKKL